MQKPFVLYINPCTCFPYSNGHCPLTVLVYLHAYHHVGNNLNQWINDANLHKYRKNRDIRYMCITQPVFWCMQFIYLLVHVVVKEKLLRTYGVNFQYILPHFKNRRQQFCNSNLTTNVSVFCSNATFSLQCVCIKFISKNFHVQSVTFN